MPLKSLWEDWAREWGLAHRRERAWIHRNERIVGERGGFLIRVGWGPQHHRGLQVLIRFPRADDLPRLHGALSGDPALDVLPGNPRRDIFVTDESDPRNVAGIRGLMLADNYLWWGHHAPLGVPTAADARDWVDALMAAVARATPPFDGRCETCGTGRVARYSIADDVPRMLCRACLDRLKAEGELAERSHRMVEADHARGAVTAGAAALVGALVWAALSAPLGRNLAPLAALFIGGLVAWAYGRGAGRIDAAGRAIAAGLTVASVELGEILFLAWWVARRGHPFGLDAGWSTYLKMWKDVPVQQVTTLLLALIGASFATQVMARPRLGMKIEIPG